MMPWDSFLTEQDRAVITVGGATSNCIRATVFDAASYNYRVIVPQEAVFDRIPISHAISLFDMDRQFADVVGVEQALAYLQGLVVAPAPDRKDGTS